MKAEEEAKKEAKKFSSIVDENTFENIWLLGALFVVRLIRSGKQDIDTVTETLDEYFAE